MGGGEPAQAGLWDLHGVFSALLLLFPGVGNTAGGTAWPWACCRLGFAQQPPPFIAEEQTPASPLFLQDSKNPSACTKSPQRRAAGLRPLRDHPGGSWAGGKGAKAGSWVLPEHPAWAPAQHRDTQGCRDTWWAPSKAAFWDHRKCWENSLEGFKPGPGVRMLGQAL